MSRLNVETLPAVFAFVGRERGDMRSSSEADLEGMSR